MLLQIMNPGKQALINASNGGPLATISTYEIGADPAISSINLNATGVLPQPPVFTGTNQTVYKTVVTPHEVIFTVFLPHTLEFNVGNIMLKLTGNVPFLWLIMSDQFRKRKLDNAKHYAGDIYFQSMVLKYPNIASLVNLTNLPEFYAAGPNIPNLLSMPDFYESEADQVSLQSGDYTHNKGRVIYVTKSVEHWWGVPWMMDVDDIRVFQIDGGNVGDLYTYSLKTTPPE